MNKLSYPIMIWKNYLGRVLFSMLVTAAMQFIINWLFTTMDFASIIVSMRQQLPAPLRLFLEEEFFSRFSLKGAVAFGFNHPLVLALLALNAIIIPARHIAGEIESGILELLLAYPIKRTRLLLTLWASAIMQLFVIVGAAWAGSVTSAVIYHELTYDLFAAMVKIAGNLWLFAVLIMSYTLLLATFGREAAKIGIYSAAITLTLYFLNFLSTIWEAISFIKPYNIFNYYQPQKLMFEERSFALHVTVLSILIIICLIISIQQFNRRDIP